MQLLADSAPAPGFLGSTMLVVCLLAGTVGQLAVAIISLYVSARRLPPISEEMHRDFLKRDEWLENANRMHDRIDETHSRINSMGKDNANSLETVRKEMNKGFGDLERAIGRLEGPGPGPRHRA